MHIEIAEGIRSLLIVDDEVIIGLLMEDLARELGVTNVYTCTDCESALRIIREHQLDMAILDLNVVDGTTAPVADELERLGIAFAFASGSDSGALEPRHADRQLISKPFLDDDFKRIVLDTWTLARQSTGSLQHRSERVAPFRATD
jgi:CheY-like chemotaxis protein